MPPPTPRPSVFSPPSSQALQKWIHPHCTVATITFFSLMAPPVVSAKPSALSARDPFSHRSLTHRRRHSRKLSHLGRRDHRRRPREEEEETQKSLNIFSGRGRRRRRQERAGGQQHARATRIAQGPAAIRIGREWIPLESSFMDEENDNGGMQIVTYLCIISKRVITQHRANCFDLLLSAGHNFMSPGKCVCPYQA